VEPDQHTLYGLGNGVSLSRTAIGAQQVEMAKFLLEHGANPNGPYYTARVLNLAVTTRQVEMVKLLLGHDADPHSVNDELIDAAREQTELEVVRLLQEARARQ